MRENMPESSLVRKQSAAATLRKIKARKLTRIKVLKMLAVMEQRQQVPGEPVTSHSQEFLTSGRTGRRNALPDILNEHATVVSSADLPARLQALTTSDNPSTSFAPPKDSAGTSKPGQTNGAS